MADNTPKPEEPKPIKVKETYGPVGFSNVMHTRVYTLKPGEAIPANTKKVADDAEEYDWKVED